MSAPSQDDQDDFAGFCRQATDRQLPAILDKERTAGRAEYARIAAAEMDRRGLA